MESDQMESRVSLRELLSSCITSFSVRRKDSQGCTADVKDTPPSPEEKLDDLIGPDIDLLGDHDDLRAMRRTSSEPVKSGFHIPLRQQSPFMMVLRSVEAFGSGLSSMNDSFIHTGQHSPPRMVLRSVEAFGSGLSSMNDSFIRARQHYLPSMTLRRTSSEPVKSGFHIPLRQQSPFMMVKRSVEAFGSSLSLMNDSFIRPQQHSLLRMTHRSVEAFGSGLSSMNDSFIRARQHYLPRMSIRSLESSDSGVSLKSDQSKGQSIDFKDRVSPSELDISSSVKKHVVAHDEDLVESLDDLMATRSTESNYTDVYMRSDPTIPIRCHSLPMSDFSSSEKKHDVRYVEEWIRSLDNHRPDDLIDPDIDLLGDHDDLMSMRSTESNDSGVSLQSDGSKVEVIDFTDRVSPSMTMGRPESIHSDVSLKSDWSKAEPFDFKDKVSPRGVITVTVTLAVAGLFISAWCVR